jgi:hypothetical protein
MVLNVFWEHLQYPQIGLVKSADYEDKLESIGFVLFCRLIFSIIRKKYDNSFYRNE